MPYMYLFFSGDFMPHKQQVHLPSTWTKRSVYKKMKAEHMERGIEEKDMIAESYFRSLWNKQFPDYKISKVSEI